MVRAHAIPLVILGIFVVWIVISWQWYVCGIRNLCSRVAHAPSVLLIGLSQKKISPQQHRVCAPYLLDRIGVGPYNDPINVSRLEHFLNVYAHEDLAINGLFGISDIQALRRFEWEHRERVLFPSGLGAPSGFVHEDVFEFINELACTHSITPPRI